ncbi:MAG TPA: MurR/RpiR family transcriptional regulator [Beijerinckiaceae bacterium]|nr:MurR/RpiR family transcriptional regulator [Beijerinckiaceae bacterium]
MSEPFHDPDAGQSVEARAGNILLTIRTLLPDLSKAHRQIAEMVLADPGWSVQSNVEDLAARAGVAKPTIVRFARAVGCEGLKDFKLKLAGSLALGSSYLHRAVRASDTPGEVINNVVGSTLAALAEWHRMLDPDRLNEAANVLNRARRVDCFGTGATSHFLAQDLQARLFRLGLTATSYTDAYLQLVAAATLARDDAVVAISFVGRMPALLEAVAMAKARNARIIAITRANTPLARLADIVLAVDVPADATMPVGTDAYITQTMMIEMITILLGRLRGPECVKRLEQIHRILQAKDQETDESSVVYWGWKSS